MSAWPPAPHESSDLKRLLHICLFRYCFLSFSLSRSLAPPLSLAQPLTSSLLLIPPSCALPLTLAYPSPLDSIPSQIHTKWNSTFSSPRKMYSETNQVTIKFHHFKIQTFFMTAKMISPILL